jgi:hypothetical protein
MASLSLYFARCAYGPFAAASAIALHLPLAVQAQESGQALSSSRAWPKEKEDRKVCKIEICKAFAAPSDGSANRLHRNEDLAGRGHSGGLSRRQTQLALGPRREFETGCRTQLI